MSERDLRAEVKDCINSVTLVNPSFEDDPKSNLIIQFLDNTSLNIKDILKLTLDSIFDDSGKPKDKIHIKNSQSKKYEDIDISSMQETLMSYKQWLFRNDIKTKWLFPDEQDRHINERNFYLIMQRVGDLLGINYLGTHSMRKTGAYRVYVQSGYNISLVMNLLNHSSQAMTLKYLGLDRESTENMLDKINFD
ncbi:tyrosine-type recombinase/integrase (plasmid) [Apilactobacillus apisilvae]|uniref:Tyrosine-type recombinase/integrase n=1 Tax=Apilactobacillus apisilvae TaxID=2923364 RepID=A0ABY4PL46_9LACO|nr:tyrosine-type recombinase/integrase [Apilactobacillus apisilvae]